MLKINNKRLAFLITALVAALLIGTVASFLTDTATNTNTMTVGHVHITMDEAIVDVYGRPVNSRGPGRTEIGNDYLLLPGLTYMKDPVIYVQDDSVDSYVFVAVNNQIAAIEDQTWPISAQIAECGFTKIGELADGWEVYKYDQTAHGGDEIPVFYQFKIGAEWDNDDMAPYMNSTVVIKAFAAQHAGFENAEDAWDNAFGNQFPLI